MTRRHDNIRTDLLLSDELDFGYFQGFDGELTFLHSRLNLPQQNIADSPIDKTQVIVDFFVKIEFLFFLRIEGQSLLFVQQFLDAIFDSSGGFKNW